MIIGIYKVKIDRYILFPLMFLYLHGATTPQYILFGVDKDRDIVIKKLSIAKEILRRDRESKDRYDLDCKIVSLGTFYAIKTSPIDRYEIKERLKFILKPSFPNLILLNISQKRESSQGECEATTEIINYQDKSEEHGGGLYDWLNRWYAFVALLLLGAFYFYKRRDQIKKMKIVQKELMREQESTDEKLKKI